MADVTWGTAAAERRSRGLVDDRHVIGGSPAAGCVEFYCDHDGFSATGGRTSRLFPGVIRNLLPAEVCGDMGLFLLGERVFVATSMVGYFSPGENDYLNTN